MKQSIFLFSFWSDINSNSGLCLGRPMAAGGVAFSDRVTALAFHIKLFWDITLSPTLLIYIVPQRPLFRGVNFYIPNETVHNFRGEFILKKTIAMDFFVYEFIWMTIKAFIIHKNNKWTLLGLLGETSPLSQ